MIFNLVDSYFIDCKDKYDEYGLIVKWQGIILVNDNGDFIGMSINNDDIRQLIIGKMKQDKKIELYRLFDKKQSVYLYEFSNRDNTQSYIPGTFSAFQYNGLGYLGDCSLELKPYNDDYKEIVAFYQDTFSKIYDAKDTFKLSIISQILKSSMSNQEIGKEDCKYYKK